MIALHQCEDTNVYSCGFTPKHQLSARKCLILWNGVGAWEIDNYQNNKTNSHGELYVPGKIVVGRLGNNQLYYHTPFSAVMGACMVFWRTCPKPKLLASMRELFLCLVEDEHLPIDHVHRAFSFLTEYRQLAKKVGKIHPWCKKSNSNTDPAYVSTSLRFSILKKDGYTCCLCGRNTKEDGVKLHVDHIHPVSKGGFGVRKNLQTLCQDCNLGKGVNSL
jgi:hypothetical protein